MRTMTAITRYPLPVLSGIKVFKAEPECHSKPCPALLFSKDLLPPHYKPFQALLSSRLPHPNCGQGYFNKAPKPNKDQICLEEEQERTTEQNGKPQTSS
ncbi:hypothetical protein E5288_WYG005622 [Bos mutus]|uniref:Uncharacterized protein n=1 Tax=Bos mutus TaxID=72004 RepID=A0A6B0RSS6_9CETA|nr:hypothetical protein [Bos mutus]